MYSVVVFKVATMWMQHAFERRLKAIALNSHGAIDFALVNVRLEKIICQQACTRLGAVGNAVGNRGRQNAEWGKDALGTQELKKGALRMADS